ncbi:MAG: hypothetical protein PHS92_02385 [Candidatus Gracilibacteria bacterium]|nr:hypothetical protein [Candidatus Gracilibacteria bacterium]
MNTELEEFSRYVNDCVSNGDIHLLEAELGVLGALGNHQELIAEVRQAINQINNNKNP